MSEDRRLSAPGSLRGGDGLAGAAAVGGAVAATVEPALAGGMLPSEPLAEFARRHGLKPSAQRPPALLYLRQLWQRRHFIVGFATARNIAMYTDARLGQLWQVLTPLLNAAVYFLIFGLLLHTNRGVPNFPAFLVTGIFVFNFTQRSFIIASRVIRDSLPLIRALHFPRACLPLGYVVIELQQLLLSFAVLLVIVLVTGEPITWQWLLVLPALLLQTLFNVGSGLLLARWGAGFDDVSQLLPFIARTWLYASGVIFSIQALALQAGSHSLKDHPTVAYLMQINPAAVYITLIRNSLLSWQPGSQPYNGHLCAVYRYFPDNNPKLGAYCHPIVGNPGLWAWGVAWALALLVVGFFAFWRAEVRYGRG